jgi:hypothetical protein
MSLLAFSRLRKSSSSLFQRVTGCSDVDVISECRPKQLQPVTYLGRYVSQDEDEGRKLL